ncbi:MAG: ATP-binding protein [Prevotella sp.]|nr:ATP-binding protein [Prevotella sp.]
MLQRILSLEEIQTDSIFLWGARQTGKSTLLHTLFPNARYYDLLKPNEYVRLHRNPEILIEETEMADKGEVIIIDEVQKIPALLDAVHWLMTNKELRFILCGSSVRKLYRCGANLLGGRAIRKTLYPLVSAEIPDFDIHRALNHGMLPRHYLAASPQKRLQAYIGEYLHQEIIEESIVRKLNSFTRFLEVAALSDTEIVNYTNIAQDCGIAAVTVKEYFSILQETLLGFFVPAYSKVVKRRVIQAPKFYYFDVAIPNYLLGRKGIEPGTDVYGHALEHLIVQELKAYLGYRESDKKLSYWHTLDNRYEVDAIIGEAEYAIEVKSTTFAKSEHFKGLKAFGGEYPDAKLILVSMDETPRKKDSIEIWPAKDFLKRLWQDQVIQVV